VSQSQLNTMRSAKKAEDWSVSTMSWYAVFIWFGASLFSQSVYMAFNGQPYDANLMLESAGPFAWVLVAIEVFVWGIVALFFGGKVFNRIQVTSSEISSSDTVAPQS